MNTFFQKLRKENPKTMKQTSDYAFFQLHKELFTQVAERYFFRDVEGDFRVFKALVIIQSFLNKQALDTFILQLKQESARQEEMNRAQFCEQKMTEFIQDLPKMIVDNQPIVLPIFTKAINVLYTKEPLAIEAFPYQDKAAILHACIDIFDTYGYTLFQSSFSSLQCFLSGKTSACFYHEELETIFVVNDQGRLDEQIPLFDEKLHLKSKENLVPRLIKAMEAYYHKDAGTFLAILKEEQLISDTLYRTMLSYASKRNRRRYRGSKTV